MMSTATNDPPPAPVIVEALRYAALGLRVVPIAPGEKYPKGLTSWQDAATTDPDTIRNWFTGLYRGHGVGIVTGAASGIWALDVDVADGKQGMVTLLELIDAYGPLPKTAHAITGSGGKHILFRWDPDHPVTNLQGAGQRLGPGLDVRGTNGQILVAPTLHPNGTPYVWERHPDQGIADAPAWLYALYERDQTPPPVPTLAPVHDPRDDGDSAAAHVSDYHNFPALLRAAGWTQIGQSERWVRPGKSPRDGHSAILHDNGAGPLVIFSTEAPTELVNAGKPTADGSGVSLSLFGYVAATQHGGDRSACARALRERINADAPTMSERYDLLLESFTDTPMTPEADGQGLEADRDDNPLRPHLLTSDELALLKPPEPLVDGWLYRNSLAFLLGPPKKGKTFIAIDIAMSIGTGTEWVGGTITRPGKVLYVLGEGVAGVYSRLIAWRQARECEVEDRVTWLKRPVQLHRPDQISALVDICIELQPDLVVIDTFARGAVGVEENSAKEIGEAIAGLDMIKAATGACILVVHHTGKDVSRGARGSSALNGAWDTAITVAGDTKAMKLTNLEQKDAEDGHELAIGFDKVAGSIVPRRMDHAPIVDDEDRLTVARQAVLSAVRRYRGKQPLTYTDWRERITGVRATDIKPAFLSLVDDGYFDVVEIEQADTKGRLQAAVVYVPNASRLPS